MLQGKSRVSEATLEKKEIERIYFGLAVEAQQQIPSTLLIPKKKVIVISGPTGCGKSAFALMLAQKLQGEIISADSMQVYTGMDIGTAKASTQDRLLIPHHLLDIRNIKESFNVVDFYYEARQSCKFVLSHGNVPIVVGGSGFYLHSLLFGPPSGPPPAAELRKSLEEEIEKIGTEPLYERLRQIDPVYASTITKFDKQKIIRALEIITITGKKVSKHAWNQRLTPINYDFHCWFLHRPKDQLYHRIEKRCDSMLANGFLDEVEKLIKMGLLENTSACQAIGYRQAIDYLKSDRSENSYKRFVEEFKKASRHYAKRQITWFKKEPLFRWLDLDAHDYEVAADIVIQDYQNSL